MIQSMEHKEKKNERVCFGDSWETNKQNNICIIVILEGKERKEQKGYLKNNGLKFSKLEK